MLTSPLHDGISPVSVFPLRKEILRLQECTTLPGFIWFCVLSSHLLSPSLMDFNIIIRKIGTREAYGRESSVLNAQPEKVSRQKPWGVICFSLGIPDGMEFGWHLTLDFWLPVLWKKSISVLLSKLLYRVTKIYDPEIISLISLSRTRQWVSSSLQLYIICCMYSRKVYIISRYIDVYMPIYVYVYAYLDSSSNQHRLANI